MGKIVFQNSCMYFCIHFYKNGRYYGCTILYVEIEENVMKIIKECGIGACPMIITECAIGTCPAIISHAFAVVVGKSISQDALPNGVALGEHEIAVVIPQSLLDKYVAEVTGK